MTDPDPRVERVFERVQAIIDEDESKVLAFARSVWLRAQETNLKQPSKELMVAFAEAVNEKFAPTPRDFDCPVCEQKKGTACTVRGDFHIERSNLARDARVNWPPLL